MGAKGHEWERGCWLLVGGCWLLVGGYERLGLGTDARLCFTNRVNA
jgi:hypothetical protein